MKKIILFFVTIFFFSCQDEKKVETENNPASKVKNLANSFKTDKLQTFEFILKEDTLFVGKEGTKIFIPKDLFENYTNGKITFELKEFYTKEDIILNGLSTITDKDEVLESSGMFYVNFKEDGKQLNIKEGKNYNVEIANKPLLDSNIYYNDNDSIFKWKLSDNIINTLIPDIKKNCQFGIMNGEGGYFIEKTKNISKNSIDKLLEINCSYQISRKGDTFFLLKYEEVIYKNKDKIKVEEYLKKKIKQEEIYYSIYDFATNKLGWINIDKILIYETQKEFSFSIKENININSYNISFVYLNNKTFINYFQINDNFTSNVKISGKIKGIIYSTNDDKIYYDSFYIDINSKPNFELDLKETTLEKLKQELVTP